MEKRNEESGTLRNLLPLADRPRRMGESDVPARIILVPATLSGRGDLIPEVLCHVHN
jgi:hypothetical protein